MNKGICFLVLFTFLSSCALLKKEKITDVILNGENLLESEITDNISTFTYMRKTAPFDSLLVQLSFNDSFTGAFDCHLIKGKTPYFCEPLMRNKWNVKLEKNREKNRAEMTAEVFLRCNKINYRILASYSGPANTSPDIEPH